MVAKISKVRRVWSGDYFSCSRRHTVAKGFAVLECWGEDNKGNQEKSYFDLEVRGKLLVRNCIIQRYTGVGAFKRALRRLKGEMTK